MVVNKPLLIMAAISCAIGSVQAAPASFTPDQAKQIQCVARLSIVASEQERGTSSALAYPPLAESGAYFAQIVGEKLMAATGRSKEAVRDAFVAGVAAEQKDATVGGKTRELPRAEVIACLELMESVAPAPPPPSLPQCAAMVSLAYDEVHAREGLSKSAKDLATIAAVLDARAREEMRGAGKSRTDVDHAMSETRAEIVKDVARREADGVSAGLDFQDCFDMATE